MEKFIFNIVNMSGFVEKSMDIKILYLVNTNALVLFDPFISEIVDNSFTILYYWSICYLIAVQF